MTARANIVPAKPGDATVVADIVRAQVPRYGEIMPTAFERWADKVHTGLPTSMAFEIIKAHLRPVGFMATTLVSSTLLYLQALYFYPEFQRRGLGGDVVAQLAERVRDNGGRYIVLQAHQQASWAISFYESQGFAIVTDDLDQIRAYEGGLLHTFALPKTVLMSLDVMARDTPSS